MTDATTHGFTPEQVTWLEKRFNRVRSTHVGFDRPTIMWLLGGLAIFGLSVSGVLYSETRSVQEDVSLMKGDIKVMQTDINGMKTDINGMKTDIDGLKSDIASMKTDIDGMKTDIDGMRVDIDVMKTDINGIKEEQASLKVQVQANTATLLRIETLLDERLPKD